MNAQTPVVDDTGPAGESQDALRVLADYLTRVAFTEGAVAHLLRAPNPEHVLSSTARYAYYADDSLTDLMTTAVGTLTRLFVLNRPVETREVEVRLEPKALGAMKILNLLCVDVDRYRGTASITPYRSRFFLSDRLFTSAGPGLVTLNRSADVVMPPHASSLMSIGAMARPTDSFLDVGCAGGFVAMTTERLCRRVSGVDINARCIGFARANAVLNRSSATFTTCDIRAFVADDGYRFSDLLFNSPTLPRLGNADVELAQMSAEQAVRLIVTAAPRVLRAGGLAQIQVLVEVPGKLGSVQKTVSAWLAGADISELSVTELDAPHVTISHDQLRRGRLDGRNQLVGDRADADLLIASLLRREIAEVVPAMIRVRV